MKTTTAPAATDFAAAFPARTAHVRGSEPSIAVPLREIALSDGDVLRVYDTSGPQGHDPSAGLRPCASRGCRKFVEAVDEDPRLTAVW